LLKPRFSNPSRNDSVLLALQYRNDDKKNSSPFWGELFL